MTGYVTTPQGERWQLPPLLEWELEYTSGSPCDSFWLRCPFDGSNGAQLRQWSRFEAFEGAEQVFAGVVDECRQSISRSGRSLELSGRGMAALLLDNEALPQDYGAATLADILRDHVAPYGIQLAGQAGLPAVSPFSVTSGSSEWTVLHDFARYYGGVEPRFDRRGRLVLTGWQEARELQVGDGVPVTELVCVDKRYGVLSEVWVRDRYEERVEKVADSAFQARGGCARRVVTMPGRSNWQAMRYTGQFQLEQAGAQALRLELEIPVLFYAWPGDLVRLARTGWDRNGCYRVLEAQVRLDSSGGSTRLELGEVRL